MFFISLFLSVLIVNYILLVYQINETLCMYTNHFTSAIHHSVLQDALRR